MNGSVEPVAKKFEKLKIETELASSSGSAEGSPLSPINGNLKKDSNPKNKRNSPKSSAEEEEIRRKNIKSFLNLRPEGYIDRFGSKTPDFDQYMENMEILRNELLKKKN